MQLQGLTLYNIRENISTKIVIIQTHLEIQYLKQDLTTIPVLDAIFLQ